MNSRSAQVIELAREYKNVSGQDFRQKVIPLYAEVVLRRDGYIHARQFLNESVAAHRFIRVKSALPQSARKGPGHRPSVSRSNTGRPRASHARARSRPAAPDDPPSGLRKLTNLHSCEECGCSGSHSLVRFEA